MNEPAFPQLKYKDTEHFEGLTIRDYFAAQAMQAILSNSKFSSPNGCFSIKNIEVAWEIADAMLAEREKKL